MGEDMDCPLVASPATADQMAPLSDTPQAFFDVLQETLIHFSPAVRWEQDLTSSKLMSHSQNLLLGGAIMHRTTYICIEAAHPDAILFGC